MQSNAPDRTRLHEKGKRGLGHFNMFHFAYEVPLVAIREALVRGKGDMSVDFSRVPPDKTKPKQHMLYDS
ncbi:hypothetical protein GCM10007377_09660 [Galliscardovia ingluviei]|uniref:Uncharacterized protein n=1 Tax=Galliscardovia ingluviei TaxID=1769422 RepID=A0A8J3AIQ1_9BIFI|nr:hypothetical protein GCM10007377_09660 [Galliscardovia ingluviei]